MTFDEKIGARLAELLKDRDIAQAELAKKLGISDSAVSAWVTGSPIPDNKFLRVCMAIETSPAWLLLGKGEAYLAPDHITEETAQYRKEMNKKGKLKAVKKIRESICRKEIERLDPESKHHGYTQTE